MRKKIGEKGERKIWGPVFVGVEEEEEIKMEERKWRDGRLL